MIISSSLYVMYVKYIHTCMCVWVCVWVWLCNDVYTCVVLLCTCVCLQINSPVPMLTKTNLVFDGLEDHQVPTILWHANNNTQYNMYILTLADVNVQSKGHTLVLNLSTVCSLNSECIKIIIMLFMTPNCVCMCMSHQLILAMNMSSWVRVPLWLLYRRHTDIRRHAHIQ